MVVMDMKNTLGQDIIPQYQPAQLKVEAQILSKNCQKKTIVKFGISEQLKKIFSIPPKQPNSKKLLVILVLENL